MEFTRNCLYFLRLMFSVEEKKKYGSTISTNLWQSLENIFRSQAFLLDDEEFTSGWIESYVIPIPSLPMAYFQVD